MILPEYCGICNSLLRMTEIPETAIDKFKEFEIDCIANISGCKDCLNKIYKGGLK